MILKPDKQYTFPEIFELNVETDDLLIEAKNDEMERGFRQLAVELIAASEPWNRIDYMAL